MKNLTLLQFIVRYVLIWTIRIVKFYGSNISLSKFQKVTDKKRVTEALTQFQWQLVLEVRIRSKMAHLVLKDSKDDPQYPIKNGKFEQNE